LKGRGISALLASEGKLFRRQDYERKRQGGRNFIETVRENYSY